VRKIPGVTVIGGYLGAGKTTLLNHLLKTAQGQRIAALVNDLASINVDAALVRRHPGETIGLANGCICCSLSRGFSAALARIRARGAELDQVLVEASGVADPTRIARLVQAHGLALERVLVVADAEQVLEQTRNAYVGGLVTRQLEQADLIVVNKADLVQEAELASLSSWVQEVAPHVPQVVSVRGEVSPEMLAGIHPRTEVRGETMNLAEEPRHPTIQAWSIACPNVLSVHDLARFAGGLNQDIYRAKGFVRLAEDPGQLFVYQQVGRRWGVEKSVDSTHDGAIVVIGQTGATTLAALQALLQPGGEMAAARNTTRLHFRGGNY
jgi:G3E family GTPase